MRTSITIFLTAAFTVMAMAINAQNYQSIRSDRLSIYKTLVSSYGLYDVRAVRIDSIEVNGADSILHLFHSIRKIDYQCYDIQSPPWFGKSVIIKPDGTNLFLNRNNDTIIIKTQGAWVGYQWTCFTESNGNWVKAVIESIEEESFLSVTDTVKTIRFIYFDSNNQPIYSGVHDKSIKISKNYGLVQAMPFYVFPNINYYDHFDSEPIIEYELAGIDNEIGQSNITYYDFYNYDVGDEFHIYNLSTRSLPPPSYEYRRKEIRTIVDRINYKNDSIIYKISRCGYYFKKDQADTTLYLTYQDTITQKIILNNEFFDKLPQEKYLLNSQNCAKYLLMQNGYVNRFVKIVQAIASDVCIYTNNCYTQTIFDGCEISNRFIEGLGGPYYSCWYMTTVKKNELVYYKKGDEIWGEPYYCDVLLGTQDLPHTAHDVIEVYPNPAKNFITVKLKEYPVEIIITDLAGRLQKHKMLNAEDQQIDISSLPKGFYFGLIYSKDLFLGGVKFIRE